MRGIILSLAFLFSASPALAQATTYTAERLQMRAEPSYDARVVSSVPADQPVYALGCGGGWCEITYMGVRGFTRQRSLIEVERPERQPAPRPAPAPADVAVSAEVEPVAAPSEPVERLGEAPVVAPAQGVALAQDNAPAHDLYAPMLLQPGTATLLSVLITGAGHFYAGESGTGALLLLGSAAAIGVGYAMTASSINVSCSSSYYNVSCSDNTNYTPLVVGGLVSFGMWLYGVADAPKAVERYNASVRRPTVAVAPSLSRDHVGLSLRVGL